MFVSNLTPETWFAGFLALMFLTAALAGSMGSTRYESAGGWMAMLVYEGAVAYTWYGIETMIEIGSHRYVRYSHEMVIVMIAGIFLTFIIAWWLAAWAILALTLEKKYKAAHRDLGIMSLYANCVTAICVVLILFPAILFEPHNPQTFMGCAVFAFGIAGCCLWYIAKEAVKTWQGGSRDALKPLGRIALHH